MRRRLCLCLAAVCLLSCVGCADGAPVSSDPASSNEVTGIPPSVLQHLSLAYSADDTLNPFAAATEVNLRLANLLFESLTVMAEDMTPRPCLASAVDTPDPTHLVASLREGAVFSDGTPVRAADAVASFQQAKGSKNYSALLANVVSAKGDEAARTVTFTLAAPDRQAAACLTFPVVKADSLTKDKAAAPVGSGLYTLQGDQSGHRLQPNPHATTPPHFQTVLLRHLPNTDSLYYGLSAGNISYYFNDLSGDSIPRVSGAHKAVDMPALFYLGVNTWRGALAQPPVRQALSLLLDRPAIANAACAGWAEGSTLPLHPRFGPVAQLKLPAVVRDLEGATQRLTATLGNTPLTLELIYHKDNAVREAAAQQICQQAQGAGVTIKPVALAEGAYRSRLQGGQYDLYLGEIRLTADMSLRPLLAGGAASYGINASGPAAVAYRQYTAGDLDAENFLRIFSEDLPFIPLCWRRGFAAYDRRLTAVTPTAYDAYAGLAGWQ